MRRLSRVLIFGVACCEKYRKEKNNAAPTIIILNRCFFFPFFFGYSLSLFDTYHTLPLVCFYRWFAYLFCVSVCACTFLLFSFLHILDKFPGIWFANRTINAMMILMLYVAAWNIIFKHLRLYRKLSRISNNSRDARCLYGLFSLFISFAPWIRMHMLSLSE